MPLEKTAKYIKNSEVVDAPTVGRDSIAYYREQDLVLTQVGANQPRFRYDDEGNFIGFLVEPNPMTSLITESEDFSDDQLWNTDAIVQNFALESESLNETGAWARTRISDVEDSGIAAPSIGGDSFGNYWKVIPNTDSGTHFLQQILGSDLPSGRGSLLARVSGYDGIRIQLVDSAGTGSLGIADVNLSTGEVATLVGSIDTVTAIDKGAGDYLINFDWSGATDFQRLRFLVLNGASASYAGNGTDGILVTRVQVSESHARYATTTDTAVDTTESTLTITGTTTGPDDEAASATVIAPDNGPSLLEYRELPDRIIENTTFNFATSTLWSAQAIAFIPEDIDVLPFLHAMSDPDEDSGGLVSVSWSTAGSLPANESTDVLIAVIASNRILSTPSGWTKYAEIDSTGTLAAKVILQKYWRRGGITNTGSFSESSGNATIIYGQVFVIRGAVETGTPFVEFNESTGASGTAVTLNGGTANDIASYVFLAAGRGNDAAANNTSNWTNNTTGTTDIAVHVNGAGTSADAGCGIAVASFEYEPPITGYIIGNGDMEARSSIFVKHESGESTVELYNALDLDDDPAVFNLSAGELVSGEGEIVPYANNFYRIANTKQTAIPGSRYGFGFRTGGTVAIFGANLIPTIQEFQYLLDDTTMVGDVVVQDDGANLVFTTVPEPNPFEPDEAAATIWTAGTYADKARVIENHILYESAVGSNTDQPSVGVLADPQTWVEVAPSSQWRMFNLEWGADTATTLEGDIEIAIQSSKRLTDFALHGVEAEGVQVRVIEGNEVLFDETRSLIGTIGTSSYWAWLFDQANRPRTDQLVWKDIPWSSTTLLSVRIFNTGAPVTVGKFVPGFLVDLGATVDAIEVGGRAVTERVTRNQFGRARIRENQREVDTKRFNFVIEESEEVHRINELIKAQRANPTTWVAYEDDPAGIIFGFRDRRGVQFTLWSPSVAELLIEEI